MIERIVDWWLLWWPFLIMYALLGIFLVVIGLILDLGILIIGLIVILGLFLFSMGFVYSILYPGHEGNQ